MDEYEGLLRKENCRGVWRRTAVSAEDVIDKKARELQIHPDKDLAARLHAKDPEKYTDNNV